MPKTLTGKVVSNTMQKTVVISVERKLRHPLYRKVITKHKKYKAHYEAEQKFSIGDTISIRETRPISKNKHFIVVEERIDKNDTD